MNEIKEPPIGIEPEYIWKAKRARDLTNALIRYIKAGLINEKCVDEWIAEIKKINSELDGDIE